MGEDPALQDGDAGGADLPVESSECGGLEAHSRGASGRVWGVGELQSRGLMEETEAGVVGQGEPQGRPESGGRTGVGGGAQGGRCPGGVEAQAGEGVVYAAGQVEVAVAGTECQGEVPGGDGCRRVGGGDGRGDGGAGWGEQGRGGPAELEGQRVGAEVGLAGASVAEVGQAQGGVEGAEGAGEVPRAMQSPSERSIPART